MYFAVSHRILIQFQPWSLNSLAEAWPAFRIRLIGSSLLYTEGLMIILWLFMKESLSSFSLNITPEYVFPSMVSMEVSL